MEYLCIKILRNISKQESNKVLCLTEWEFLPQRILKKNKLNR